MNKKITKKRLPIPGKDDNVWGIILNSFLLASHTPTGGLQPSAIKQAGAVTEINGKTTTNGNGQITIAVEDVEGSYAPPESGIPSTDLSSEVQSALNNASSAVQQINGKTGNDITLSASDVGAPTTLTAAGDVNISSPTNDEVLTYDSTTDKWVNQISPSAPVTSVAGKTGSITLDESDITNLSSDLSTVRTTANSAVQQVNGKSGNDITLSASDVGADTSGSAADRVYPKGNWTASTSYSVNDAVSANSAWWICSTAHTAASVFNDDLSNWTLAASVGVRVYDATAHGCDPTGTSDSAVPLISLINTATATGNGGIIYFPYGTYVFNQPVYGNWTSITQATIVPSLIGHHTFPGAGDDSTSSPLGAVVFEPGPSWNGSYNRAISGTAVTTAGSTHFTDTAASFTSNDIGAQVSCPFVPQNTTITSIQSSTVAILSTTMTYSAAGQTAELYSCEYLIDYCGNESSTDAAGMICGFEISGITFNLKNTAAAIRTSCAQNRIVRYINYYNSGAANPRSGVAGGPTLTNSNQPDTNDSTGAIVDVCVGSQYPTWMNITEHINGLGSQGDGVILYTGLGAKCTASNFWIHNSTGTGIGLGDRYDATDLYSSANATNYCFWGSTVKGFRSKSAINNEVLISPTQGDYPTLLSGFDLEGTISSRVISDATLTTSGETLTDPAGSFTTADVGSYVYGTQYPSGTKITGYISSTEVTTNNNATTSGSSQSIVVAINNEENGSIIAVKSSCSQKIVIGPGVMVAHTGTTDFLYVEASLGGELLMDAVVGDITNSNLLNNNTLVSGANVNGNTSNISFGLNPGIQTGLITTSGGQTIAGSLGVQELILNGSTTILPGSPTLDGPPSSGTYPAKALYPAADTWYYSQAGGSPGTWVAIGAGFETTTGEPSNAGTYLGETIADTNGGLWQWTNVPAAAPTRTTTSGSVSSSSGTITLPTSTSAGGGDTIVIAINNQGNAITITGAGATWTSYTEGNLTTWLGANAGGGQSSVSYTQSGTAQSCWYGIGQYTNLNTTTPVSASSLVNGSSVTTLSTGVLNFPPDGVLFAASENSNPTTWSTATRSDGGSLNTAIISRTGTTGIYVVDDICSDIEGSTSITFSWTPARSANAIFLVLQPRASGAWKYLGTTQAVETVDDEAANFTAAYGTDYVVTTASTASLPQPTAGGLPICFVYGGGTITINPYASETINAPTVLWKTGQSVTLITDGTNWYPKARAGNFDQLAVISYAPTTNASYTSTGSLAAIDSTNLSFSFYGPLSTNVLVKVSLLVKQATSGDNIWLTLVNHGTTTQVTNCPASTVEMSTAFSLVDFTFNVTGLTAGQQYTWDVAWQDDGTHHVTAQVQNKLAGSGVGSPCVMQVIAV